MNTPNHVTDEQINALWEREQRLQLARNFVQAYERLEREQDEREIYAGFDPRNHTGEKL
jgi:hypothetical protein